uniref:Uncharacterized protein n=1 Tax=Arundo donax TaxID=35708 RepID=A0A0A9GNI7_ARUDO
MRKGFAFFPQLRFS